jgi:hypothetical protein
LNSFEYGGVQFKKINVGEITIFQSEDYLFPAYKLNFRIDPRKNNLPVEGDVLINENVIVTSSQELRNCKGIAKAYGDIIFFLVFADGNVTVATTNKTEAALTNELYADCSSSSKRKTVITLGLGNETSAVQDKDYSHCYKLTIKDCDSLDSLSERFIMAAVARYNNETL